MYGAISAKVAEEMRKPEVILQQFHYLQAYSITRVIWPKVSVSGNTSCPDSVHPACHGFCSCSGRACVHPVPKRPHEQQGMAADAALWPSHTLQAAVTHPKLHATSSAHCHNST
jgi:hypothetical protein